MILLLSNNLRLKVTSIIITFGARQIILGWSLAPTCNALLCVSHTLQSASASGQEARIVEIDFSAAFDRVNHLGVLYKLCSVGIGGSVLSILTQFLSNRSQQVIVDGCRSKLVNVVSGVPQGSVFASYCSFCALRSFFTIWKIS